MIKIGCTGYPVSRERYHARLGLVELASFEIRTPSKKILSKWRMEAPHSMEFIVSTSPIIKMPLRDRGGAKPVPSPIHHTMEAAGILSSKLALFHCPTKLHPTADHIRDLQRFFKINGQNGISFVWNPPASWPESLVRDLSLSLHVIPAVNPLQKAFVWNKSFNYFRITERKGIIGGPLLTDDEMKKLRAACDKPLNYVIFNTGLNSFRNALTFTKLVSV